MLHDLQKTSQRHQKDGVYQAIYTAGQAPGLVRVGVTTSNKKTAKLNFQLTKWQVSAKRSTLHVKDGVMHSVGEPVQIQFQLKTAEGEPFFAQTVHLEMPNTLKLTEPPAPTDDSGKSTAMVTSTRSGRKSIKALVNGNLVGSVVVNFEAGLPALHVRSFTPRHHIFTPQKTKFFRYATHPVRTTHVCTLA